MSARYYSTDARVHGAVARAIRIGLLVKQPCARCGETKVEAHHEDYSRPLDVIWLCRKHHMQRHRERGDVPTRQPQRWAPSTPPPPERFPLSLTLPPELVAEVDAIAEAEDRSRAKTIEIAVRQFVQSYRHKAAAA
jgi:ribosomal protein S27AE